MTGLLTVAPACSVCGLELGRHDAGDGPAVFANLILGALAVGLMFWVEQRFAPPVWVHVALWVPFIGLGSLLLLRLLKATMIALQYKHRREDYDPPG